MLSFILLRLLNQNCIDLVIVIFYWWIFNKDDMHVDFSKNDCMVVDFGFSKFSGPPTPSSLNLSVNVNCSMDLIQSPTRPKCTTTLNVIPQPSWCQDPVTPRSYTSVNLMLRPPSTEPQAPIDITSQNSSLTYTTSSFDSQKGLASRLQITVGPGGTSSVSSVRTRPRSSYHPEENPQDVIPARAGSLPDLAGNTNGESNWCFSTRNYLNV